MRLALLACALVACTADTFRPNGDADAAAEAAVATGPTCGATRCGASTCCVAVDGGASCQATCPNGTASLACTSSVDCTSGLVCCMHQGSSNTSISSCLAQCGQNDVQLCMLPSDPTCNASEPCSSSNIKDWNLPQSFGTCGGHGIP